MCSRFRFHAGAAPIRACLAALALAGCTKVGPDYEQPVFETPAGWKAARELPAAAVTAAEEENRWWFRFDDHVLNALVAEALANNTDLRVAASRVRLADAILRGRTAAFLPVGELFGEAGRNRNRDANAWTQNTGNAFYAFGTLSYEFDLWGKNARAVEAAEAGVIEAIETRKAAAISLASRVAETYFHLLGLEEQRRIATEVRGIAADSLALTEKRHAEGRGVTTKLDILQARARVQAAEAAIAFYDREIPVTENALCLLLGSAPRKMPRGRALHHRPEPPGIPAGIPSELLLRRPDIAAAEFRLIAANANIGVARAALFPSVSLTAEGGFQSREFSTLFSGQSRAWSVAPTVNIPIFNRGRIRADIAASEAERDAALEQYRGAIITAFGEVDNAITGILALRRQLAHETESERDSHDVLRLSRLRYEAGVDQYLDVLLAQESVFNAGIRRARTREELLIAHARLRAAMGGAWSENPPAEPIPTETPKKQGDPAHVRNG